jgi:hypothetical protein
MTNINVENENRKRSSKIIEKHTRHGKQIIYIKF